MGCDAGRKRGEIGIGIGEGAERPNKKQPEQRRSWKQGKEKILATQQ
jgi:hypothetical protein